MANIGRKTKLTASVQRRIVKHIERGNYAYIAAQAAGIDQSTYYEWLKRGETEPGSVFAEFAKAIKDAEGVAETRRIATIERASKENWTAAAWIAERKYPERWGKTDRTKVEAEVKITTDPRDEIARLLTRLAARSGSNGDDPSSEPGSGGAA